MLWGAGTALGEIPPYAFSYQAAKAGRRNQELDNMFGMQQANAQLGLVASLVTRMQNWMLRFIQRQTPFALFFLHGVANCMLRIVQGQVPCALFFLHGVAHCMLHIVQGAGTLCFVPSA